MFSKQIPYAGKLKCLRAKLFGEKSVYLSEGWVFTFYRYKDVLYLVDMVEPKRVSKDWKQEY